MGEPKLEGVKTALKICQGIKIGGQCPNSCPLLAACQMGCGGAPRMILDCIQQLEAKAPRWISVEERLPEVDKRYDGYEYSAEVLVYDGLRRRTAYYCHTSGVWYDSRYEDDTFEATHWMELPEPPEEE